MDKKLQEERVKAQQLLNFAKQQQSRTFNLSDLKSDKTQTFSFESPLAKQRSPFTPSEMSARSTLLQKNLPNRGFKDFNYDEIMKSSSSAAVRDKYRESLGVSKISELRTANTSIASDSTGNKDFWDQARVSTASFCGKNMSVNANDTFKPAENMKWDFNECSNESNWEDGTMKAPEMSFGKYAQGFVGSNDVRDLYSKNSPVKKPRCPLVEISSNDTPGETSRFGKTNLEKLIKNLDTPKAKHLLDKFGRLHKEPLTSARPDTAVAEMSGMVNSLSFDERENATMFDNVPVKDNAIPEIRIYDLVDQEKTVSSRGLKRRASLSSEFTPKTTLDKCLRSKSPTVEKELRAVAASLLKPELPVNNFKVPRSRSGGRLTFEVSSPEKVSREEFISLIKSRADYSPPSVNKSPSSREYLTANSMNTSGEKLSLPNYGLVSLSPTTSSHSLASPDSSQTGLKRTASQLSNGSEFQGDFLPIRIKKSNRKLSWESVKLHQSVTKSITIQNGPQKKLSLRVKVKGTGFSIAAHDYIRMIPNEARTFEVKFSPTSVGPSCGQLIFELATDNKCMMLVPLFAYGGHSSIRIEGLQKGPIGPAFVTMGQVNMLNKVMQQQITLKNLGTLPGFVSLFFEKTKWSDFSLSESLTIIPSNFRLAPGESTQVEICFKATKEEIRKIFTLNKEITIVGEICVISGDEPTRLRLLRNMDIVPPHLLKFLPKNLKNESEFKRQLTSFNENLEGARITLLTDHIKTHEIALTVNRSLDETLMTAAEFSMTDDTSTSFATFYETNNIEDATDPVHDTLEMYESRFFRVTPAQIVFNRRKDVPEVPKLIVIESTCADPLFAEAVSSKHDLVSAIKSCGIIQPGECVHISVTPRLKAFQLRSPEILYVSVLIGNAKVDIPVKFVD